MADIFTVKCKDCGSIFSVTFGTYRKTCENIDKSIIEKYGEKIYSQYMEILEKSEKKIDFNIEDYNYFKIECVHDLDYKRKILTLRKRNNEEGLKNLKKFIEKFEKADEIISEESSKFFKEELFNKYTSSLKEIEEALESRNPKVIDAAYNNKFVITKKRFEKRLFICPKCGMMNNKSYLGIYTNDYEYALKMKCSECSAEMVSYDSFEDAIEENAFHCTKCGSNNLIEEHAMHLD